MLLSGVLRMPIQCFINEQRNSQLLEFEAVTLYWELQHRNIKGTVYNYFMVEKYKLLL